MLLGHTTTSLDQTMTEVVPMLGKTSITLDHVNDELEKVGQDHRYRGGHGRHRRPDRPAATRAAAKPVKVVSSAAAGITHAFASFRSKRDQRGGVV